MKASVKCTQLRYICANERIKLMGTLDGYFPDFGHHLLGEMGGLWLYPIKILDGFWMNFKDHTNKIDCYLQADQFENYPEKNVFYFGREMGPTCVSAVRTQIAPEGICGITVTYEFVNNGRENCECESSFLARTDLRPGWLAECSGVYDGKKDEAVFNESENSFYVKDSDNPWYAMIGCKETCCDHKTGDIFGPDQTRGQGISVVMTHKFQLKAGEHKVLTFYIAGSDISSEHLKQQYGKLTEEKDFEKEKQEKYAAMYASSQLTVGDPHFEDIYRWVKVNTDWLILSTSKGDRGIMGGVPEYTWWFGCDSCYTIQGLLAMGEYQLSRDTLKLLLEYSNKVNGNGRIVHEILPDGHCPNPGNVQETAQFVSTVWKYYQWTGDQMFLEEAFPYLGQSVQWLQEQDDDGDLFPTGYGIIEIAGLNMEMIDTAVYTCGAYESYGAMCRLMGLQAEAERYEELSEKVKKAINEELWDEENNLYCDGYTSYSMIEKRREMIEALLANARSEEIRKYVERIIKEHENDGEQEKGWLINRNWVINTPMETGVAPEDKARRALETMHTSTYVGRWGVYLCGLKQEHTMTISTGVMAAAQARYGYADRALELIQKMFDTFSKATPGAIAEMSPDWGCFVQGWTTYAVMYPIVRFFFGINPKKSENVVEICPCPPSAWPKAELAHVRVLDGEISIAYELKENQRIVSIKNPGGLMLKLSGCNLETVNGNAAKGMDALLIAEKHMTAIYSIK